MALIVTVERGMRKGICSVAVLTGAMLISAGVVATPEDSSSQAASVLQKEANRTDSLAQRGKKLRAEVENIFNSLKASNSLKPMGQGRNFITPAVVKYIPVGISFDDAEAILRAAGCDVTPRSYEKLVGNQFHKFNVLGTLALPGSFLSSTELSISLIPKSPGDYSMVNEVVAEIIIMYP